MSLEESQKSLRIEEKTRSYDSKSHNSNVNVAEWSMKNKGKDNSALKTNNDENPRRNFLENALTIERRATK